MGGLRRFFVTSTRKAAADVALGEVGTLLAELDASGFVRLSSEWPLPRATGRL